MRRQTPWARTPGGRARIGGAIERAIDCAIGFAGSGPITRGLAVGLVGSVCGLGIALSIALSIALGSGACSREPPSRAAPSAPPLPPVPPKPRARGATALFKIDSTVAWPLICFGGSSLRADLGAGSGFIKASECGSVLPQALTLHGERGSRMDVWRSGETECQVPLGPGPERGKVKVPLYRLVSTTEPDTFAGTWSEGPPPQLHVPPSVPELTVQTPGQRRGVLRSARSLLSPGDRARLIDLRLDGVWLVDLDLDGVRERVDELTLVDSTGVPIGSGVFMTPGRSLEARPLRLVANPAQRHRLIAAVDLDQDGYTELWIAREPVQLTGAGRSDVAQRIDEVSSYTGAGLVTIDQLSCRPR